MPIQLARREFRLDVTHARDDSPSENRTWAMGITVRTVLVDECHLSARRDA
jgi:hypothetical protein